MTDRFTYAVYDAGKQEMVRREVDPDSELYRKLVGASEAVGPVIREFWVDNTQTLYTIERSEK